MTAEAGLPEYLVRLSNVPAVAYLRGAEAALKSNPPDVGVAAQLLGQALAILDPGKPPQEKSR